MDVYLSQESCPGRFWTVQIRKMGGYLVLWRNASTRRDVAHEQARQLAQFLGIPLVIEEAAQ